jgi:hypothetical protein
MGFSRYRGIYPDPHALFTFWAVLSTNQIFASVPCCAPAFFVPVPSPSHLQLNSIAFIRALFYFIRPASACLLFALFLRD